MATHLRDLTFRQLEALCGDRGWPAYRARQLWQWMYRRRVADPAAMTDLPELVRHTLHSDYGWQLPAVRRRQQSPDGTVKWLLALSDGALIECVLIPHEHPIRPRAEAKQQAGWRTLCVSTQVGCKMGCKFCASGMAGFTRNLAPHEIIDQLLVADASSFDSSRHLAGLAQDSPERSRGTLPSGQRVNHVVFMGMGEPFDNYAAVLQAVRILNDRQGLAIGARRITVSTSGLVPQILQFAEEGLQVELAISLHAPDDATRSRLIPINRRYPVKPLLSAARAYAARTRRQITFEYLLIRGVNDAPHQAERLTKILHGLLCHLNVIPLNPVEGFAGEPPALEEVKQFVRILRQGGLHVTVRVPRGREIDAACGQLRLRQLHQDAISSPSS